MTDARHVLLSSERFDWQTPGWFLDLVRVVAPIGFDPCTSSDNPTGARLFKTQTIEPFDDGSGVFVSSCGLLDEWPKVGDGELVFANPPYGAHLSGDVDADVEFAKGGIGAGWAKKIAAYDGGSIVSLVPVRTDAGWWVTLWHASDVVVLWKSPEHGARINFVDPSTGEVVVGSNLASTVFFRGNARRPAHARRFVEVFGRHGIVLAKGRG